MAAPNTAKARKATGSITDTALLERVLAQFEIELVFHLAALLSTRAEFTPKEVQTPDERTKLVYEVRLYLDRNPNHALAPGLPADAIIRWQENVAWASPRW